MAFFDCKHQHSCTVAALIVSAVIGVIAAFLQIAGVFTVTPVFLWVVFGIAIGYLGLLVIAAALAREVSCSPDTSLAGILGTILFAAILLAVGVTATSIVSAILVGLTLFFFALTLTGTACYVRCLTDRT